MFSYLPQQLFGTNRLATFFDLLPSSFSHLVTRVTNKMSFATQENILSGYNSQPSFSWADEMIEQAESETAGTAPKVRFHLSISMQNWS